MGITKCNYYIIFLYNNLIQIWLIIISISIIFTIEDKIFILLFIFIIWSGKNNISLLFNLKKNLKKLKFKIILSKIIIFLKSEVYYVCV